MTVTSKHRSCQLVPANGISRSAGHLKIPNLNSKVRGKYVSNIRDLTKKIRIFEYYLVSKILESESEYSRFEEKDSNLNRIRIYSIISVTDIIHISPRNHHHHILCKNLAFTAIFKTRLDLRLNEKSRHFLMFIKQFI